MRRPEFRYRLTDYDRSTLPSRFVAFLDDGVTTPEQWVPRTGRSLGQPGWGWLYHTTMMMLDGDQPNAIVETGTNLGSSTMMMAQAIVDAGRSGTIHTIELDPEIHLEARRRFQLSGVDGIVTALCGDSISTLEGLLDDLPPLAIAFLDGNHFHDHVVREFELVHAHLRPGGIVLFDNTWMIAEGDEDPRVNGALRTIVARFGGNLINLPFCSWYTPGIALWQAAAFEDMSPPAEGSFTSGT